MSIIAIGGSVSSSRPIYSHAAPSVFKRSARILIDRQQNLRSKCVRQTSAKRQTKVPKQAL